MNNENEVNDIIFYFDENDFRYEQTTLLGEGGQGAVYKTQNPNMLLKIKTDDNVDILQDEDEYEKYKENIENIMLYLQQVPQCKYIVSPYSVLKKPYCGYTMDFLDEAKSIKYYLQDFEKKYDNAGEYYKSTGGLLERIEILAGLSQIFEQLYFHTIIYADISPENVFISKNADNETNAWLIDADNMCFSSVFRKNALTPFYAAPEIINGNLNTLESDAFSFAILANKLLTLNLPFDSDDTDEDSWSAFSVSSNEEVETETDEEAENIPLWIYDDNYNGENLAGIPPSLVFTKDIKDLFQRTFSYDGQMYPETRPKMTDWVNAFEKALNMTVICEFCGQSFFMNTLDSKCGFCSESKNNPERKKIIVAQIVNSYNDSFVEEMINFENETTKEFYENIDLEAPNINSEDITYSDKPYYKLFDFVKKEHYFYNTHTHDESPIFEKCKTIRLRFENDKLIITNLSEDKITITEHERNPITIEHLIDLKIDTINNCIISIELNKFKTKYIKLSTT